MWGMNTLSAPHALPTALDGTYPRPQLVRSSWADLSGVWDFAWDDADEGLAQRWHAADPLAGDPFDRRIVVPFPPESEASGVGEPGFHPVVWYRRILTRADLDRAGVGVQGESVVLHFGAVDYRADVWLAGHYLGRHEGGSTPFSFDITPVVRPPGDGWALVVRADDDPLDVAQPRGKQDWQSDPHGIWYQRTTGIWQSVWLEAVPRLRVAHLTWSSDVAAGTVELQLELSSRPTTAASVSVQITFGGAPVSEVRFSQAEPRSRTVITLPPQANGQAYEAMLWSPEHPRLLDACVELSAPDGSQDHVDSYLGLRHVGWADRHFMLNDRPYYLRAILEQGYWPATHLAAPSAQALRDEVQLIKNLGFNSVRIHEKIEDPRFLYWTDRLGLLVWSEAPSAYEFSPTAVGRTTREWLEVIRRDASHPSIVIWVPLNESWGVQHIAHDHRQLDFARSLYHLTKSIDPSRLVISNDGWEHAESDMWTIHDYGASGKEVAANYVDATAVDELLAGIGPLGRRMKLLDAPDRGQPVVVSEFGGVSYAPTNPGDSWGYVTTTKESQFEDMLSELFQALQASPVLAGFCYTQLTDTLQEANGLTDPDRRPKLPTASIRAIVLGESLDVSLQRRPKRPIEQVTAAIE